jgi:hypothetical protein
MYTDDQMRTLFTPVMTVGKCSSVEFVDHPPETRERETVQKSLDRAIRAGNVEWQTFRVEQSGRIVPETTASNENK